MQCESASWRTWNTCKNCTCLFLLLWTVNATNLPVFYLHVVRRTPYGVVWYWIWVLKVLTVDITWLLLFPVPSRPQTTTTQLFTYFLPTPPWLHIFIYMRFGYCISSMSHSTEAAPKVCVNIITSTLQKKPLDQIMLTCNSEREFS